MNAMALHLVIWCSGRRSIPSLKSHRETSETWEQESGFPGVFCDCSDASANLLYQLGGPSLIILIIIIIIINNAVNKS